MDLFDLHCDTPTALVRWDGDFRSGSCNVTADKLSYVGRYGQLAAFCVPHDMSDDEGYGFFFRTAEKTCSIILKRLLP